MESETYWIFIYSFSNKLNIKKSTNYILYNKIKEKKIFFNTIRGTVDSNSQFLNLGMLRLIKENIF